MKKHAFGHVLVEEAICVGHFLEALGEILAVHLLGLEWGSAIFCRSVDGKRLWRLEVASSSLGINIRSITARSALQSASKT
jgi:hypothetical protein